MIQEHTEWIRHKGKELLYCDFRGLSDEDLIILIRQVDDLITNSGKKDILKINDVRGLFATPSVLPEIKRSSKLLKPYLKKSAYVGITGVKKILLEAINRVSSIGAKPFAELEDAKDWLVE